MHSQSAKFGGSPAKQGKALTSTVVVRFFWKFGFRVYKSLKSFKNSCPCDFQSSQNPYLLFNQFKFLFDIDFTTILDCQNFESLQSFYYENITYLVLTWIKIDQWHKQKTLPVNKSGTIPMQNWDYNKNLASSQ